MRRIAVAFFVAPTLVSFVYGLGVIVALPTMLLSALLFAGPLFVFLRKHGWLAWGHAVIAGLLCSIPLTLISAFSSSSGYLWVHGIRLLLLFSATGGVTGWLFWWIGVFRNAAFPSVSRRPPWSMLILIPITALLVWYGKELEPQVGYGRVVQLTHAPRSVHEEWEFDMRLATGEIVTTSMSYMGIGVSPVVGSCYLADERRSATLTNKIFRAANSVPDSYCDRKVKYDQR